MSTTPLLSEIPVATATSELRVRHAGYDIRSSVKDPNVTFPIDRMKEARDNGVIGSLASTFFSFPGITAQGRLRRVLPEWVERIRREEVDLMLLVPV
jgi:D-proline reductase (dithiol) PrdB